MAYLVNLRISRFYKLVKVKIKLKTDTGLHFFLAKKYMKKHYLYQKSLKENFNPQQKGRTNDSPC